MQLLTTGKDIDFEDWFNQTYELTSNFDAHWLISFPKVEASKKEMTSCPSSSHER